MCIFHKVNAPTAIKVSPKQMDSPAKCEYIDDQEVKTVCKELQFLTFSRTDVAFNREQLYMEAITACSRQSHSCANSFLTKELSKANKLLEEIIEGMTEILKDENLICEFSKELCYNETQKQKSLLFP